MATIVLVGGATLGAWCWKRVTPLLRNLGHEVYPLTLTGLAERAHLASASVNLDTHIQDIVSLIEVEDLSDVILVAHSLSVDPATGATDRIPERIAHLIYVDSSPSRNGESGVGGNGEWVRSRVTHTERGPLFQPPDMRDFGLSDEADIAWANSKATHHPFNTWDAIIHLHNLDALARVPKSHILCIGDDTPGQPYKLSVESEPYFAGIRHYELPFGHMAMINAPQEMTTLLHSIAAQPVTVQA